MNERREPLVTQSTLVFDFDGGGIATPDGTAVGSMQWVRHEHSRGASLGYLNLMGEPEWWFTPQGFLAWDDDLVQWPSGEAIGKVGPHGLRTGTTVQAEIKQQRGRVFFKNEWRVEGTSGHLADVVLLEDRSDQQWQLDLHAAARGPLRYLAATVPMLCNNWHHSPY